MRTEPLARIFASLGPFREIVLRGELRSGSALAERVLDIGLDGLELSPLALELARSYGLDITPEDLQPLGLSLHSNHIDFSLASPNAFTRRAAIDQLNSELAYASRYGIGRLTFHPGLVRKVDRAGALELFWLALEQVDRSQGVTRLCLENMDHNDRKLCNREDEIEATLERFPGLGLTVDLAHLGLRETAIGPFLDRFDRFISHVHVSGVIPGTPHSAVSLLRSEIDMSPYIERLAERDIAFVIENGTLEVLEESLTVMRRYCPPKM